MRNLRCLLGFCAHDKLDLELFYEFANTVLEDLDSIEVEIKRLKKALAKEER